ncbi:hypothetical protein [Planctomycetes bacterium CA13]|uniref:hypothetical protein n=1 Tax=Novipirellula herctigrandis TaxID=2527986 RepID=UPI0011B4014C
MKTVELQKRCEQGYGEECGSHYKQHPICRIGWRSQANEEGLDRELTSLVAQRDAWEAYTAAQQYEGWL